MISGAFKWFQMVSVGLERSQMVSNGSKCFQVLSNGSERSQMPSNSPNWFRSLKFPSAIVQLRRILEEAIECIAHIHAAYTRSMYEDSLSKSHTWYTWSIYKEHGAHTKRRSKAHTKCPSVAHNSRERVEDRSKRKDEK